MWNDISGYNGKYTVSIFGDIKSVARVKPNNQPIPERILKQYTDDNGYKCVSLYSDNKSKRFRVHRIVANTFIENPNCKKTVNHKDGVKSNNSVENLEWNTYSENKKHSFRVLGETHWLKGKKGKDNQAL